MSLHSYINVLLFCQFAFQYAIVKVDNCIGRVIRSTRSAGFEDARCLSVSPQGRVTFVDMTSGCQPTVVVFQGSLLFLECGNGGRQLNCRIAPLGIRSDALRSACFVKGSAMTSTSAALALTAFDHRSSLSLRDSCLCCNWRPICNVRTPLYLHPRVNMAIRCAPHVLLISAAADRLILLRFQTHDSTFVVASSKLCSKCSFDHESN